MKRYLYLYMVALASLVATSCTHKELCDDARLFHINAHITYRLDWEDTNEIDWKSPGCWPADYIPYDNLRPNKSKGLASWNYKGGKPGFLNIIGTDGGIINLGSEYTNLLIYDSDPEFNDISYLEDGAIVRATTRTKTRASHTANKFANKDEECKKSPSPLFANYFENFYAEKLLDPADVYIELQPLVFTYYIRIPIKEGLENIRTYGHTGDLSGMADGVNLLNGETLEKAVTILFDNQEDYGFDVVRVTDWGIEAIVRSYGLPGYPRVNYPTRGNPNALGINIFTKAGKMQRFECDVTEQMLKQPHGGVINWSGDDIIIEKEAGTEGSGAFDVEVEDWEYKDIILPIM